MVKGKIACVKSVSGRLDDAFQLTAWLPARDVHAARGAGANYLEQTRRAAVVEAA